MLLEYELLNIKEINFKLTCDTLSWCAIGFSDYMVNSDVIRISNTAFGVIIEDMYSKARSVPILDTY